MIVEGRGKVAPAPVRIPLTASEIRIIKDRARRQASERNYRDRRDSWGKGMTGPGRSPLTLDLRDHEYPGFIGLIGEYTLCVFINQRLGRDVVSLDLGSRPEGDRGIDTEVFRFRVQVKTRQHPDRPNLIRRLDGRGRKIPFHTHAHAFCLYRRDRPLECWLLGWVWTSELARYPLVLAHPRDHRNIVVPDTDILPASRLIKEIHIRKDMMPWH